MHIYGIENKIFKTVADQSANMKKALSDERESTQIQGGANEDNLLIYKGRIFNTFF
jgi:hypothetical protein